MVHADRTRVVLAASFIVFMAAIGFVVLPQLDQFSYSLSALHSANLLFVAGALMSAIGSYLAAAAVYQSLALRPLRYADTTLMQLAGLLVNRVLPAGIGGLGLNFLYLRSRRHTKTQAGAVVAANTVVSGIGHALLLIVVAAASVAGGQTLPDIRLPLWLAPVSIGAAIIVGMLLLRQRMANLMKRIRRDLGGFTTLKLIRALTAACAMTLLTAACLWLSLTAVNAPVSFGAAFLLLTVGVTAGTVVPTPGGLGGFEAALVAGLLATGVASSAALAGALLFRLLTFWLGLCVGAGALGLVLRRNLLTAHKSKS